MKHLLLSFPAIASTTIGLLTATVATGQNIPIPMVFTDVTLVDKVAPCPPEILSCCSKRCGEQEVCLCECYLATGQALREQERYADAVKYLQVAARICPEQGAQALIDSIYQEQRIWVYQDGKFAIATPLGDMKTPFMFPNSPEPFKKGVAVFSDENGKYFFTDKDGNILTPKPGLDGIIPAEGVLYLLKRGGGISFTTDKGLFPCYQTYSPEMRPPSLKEMRYWKNDSLLYNFAKKTAGRYDYMTDFENGVAIVKKGRRTDRYGEMAGGLNGLIDTTGTEIVPLIYENIESFGGKFFGVYLNGKFGLLDNKGQFVLPVEYEGVVSFGDDFFIFQQKGKWGVADTSGKVIIPPIYESLSERRYWRPGFEYGMAVVEKQDSASKESFFGVIDVTGKEIIPFVYERINIVDSNLLIVRQNEKYGLIERSGEVVLPLEYNDLGKFDDNYFLANKGGKEGEFGETIGGKWGLFHKSGREVVPPVYDGMQEHGQGLLVKKGDKYGLMDTLGQLVLPVEYEGVGNTLPGNLFVVTRQGKQGGVDAKGKIIFPFEYSDLSPFRKNFKVEKDSLQGLYDSAGQVIIPLTQQQVGGSIYGDTFDIKRNGLWGLVDIRGREVLPAVYQEIGYLRNGFMPCKKNGLWGLLDSTGREAIVPQYDSIRPLEEGFIWAKKQGTWFFLDAQGQKITPPRPVYDYAWPFDDRWSEEKNNAAWVQSEGKFGLINRAGKEITPLVYNAAGPFSEGVAVAVKGKNILLVDTLGREIDISNYSQAEYSSEGMIWVKKDTLWGYIDKLGQEKIPFRYQAMRRFYQGRCPVKRNDHWGYIDKNGAEIVQPMYDGVGWFEDGLLTVNMGGKANDWGYPDDGLWGIVDSTGKAVLPIEYDKIVMGQADRFWVKKDSLWRLIDKNRKDLCPPTAYEYVQVLSKSVKECYYAVKKNRLLGWVDQNGKEIVAPMYDEPEMGFFSMKNGIVRARKDKQWGLVDSTGRESISFSYQNIGASVVDEIYSTSPDYGIRSLAAHSSEDDIVFFSYYSDYTPYEGMLWVQKDNKWGLIDTAEREILAPTYDLAFKFRNGLSKVKNFDKYGFVNTKGKEVVPCILDRYHVSGENQYILIANDKKGLLFTDEQNYIPPEYDDIAWNEDPDPAYAWVIVLKNGKWGWVNHKGEIQIPCRYDAVTPFNKEGWATVLQFGLQFRINRKGEMIWEKE